MAWSQSSVVKSESLDAPGVRQSEMLLGKRAQMTGSHCMAAGVETFDREGPSVPTEEPSVPPEEPSIPPLDMTQWIADAIERRRRSREADPTSGLPRTTVPSGASASSGVSASNYPSASNGASSHSDIQKASSGPMKRKKPHKSSSVEGTASTSNSKKVRTREIRKSGMKGVRWVDSSHQWEVRYVDEGVRKTILFSADELGNEEALKRAIECRTHAVDSGKARVNKKPAVVSGVPGVHWVQGQDSWLAFRRLNGEKTRRYFPVAEYGSLDAALEAAKTYRREAHKEKAPPAEEEESGIAGITWSDAHERWKSRWSFNKRRFSKIFYAASYGSKELALAAAKAHRETAEPALEILDQFKMKVNRVVQNRWAHIWVSFWRRAVNAKLAMKGLAQSNSDSHSFESKKILNIRAEYQSGVAGVVWNCDKQEWVLYLRKGESVTGQKTKCFSVSRYGSAALALKAARAHRVQLNEQKLVKVEDA